MPLPYLGDLDAMLKEQGVAVSVVGGGSTFGLYSKNDTIVLNEGMEHLYGVMGGVVVINIKKGSLAGLANGALIDVDSPPTRYKVQQFLDVHRGRQVQIVCVADQR